MYGLHSELQEIPQAAERCYKLCTERKLQLPTQVPYLGMGSSYYAPLTLKYCGAAIDPEIASEYYYYMGKKQPRPLGVLLSQSGESSETVWCLERFEKVVTITNSPDSTLAKAPQTTEVVLLEAGPEQYSSTKTYTNTLIALYLGLGLDPKPAITTISTTWDSIDRLAQQQAEQIAKYLSQHTVSGLFILGSGPNVGTALEGALTLSETTKLNWVGMPVAQFDHGPKEAAQETVVIGLNGHGADSKRLAAIQQLLGEKSQALYLELAAPKNLDEKLTPLPLIVHLNLIMDHLSDLLQVGPTFALGGKVTIVNSEIK